MSDEAAVNATVGVIAGTVALVVEPFAICSVWNLHLAPLLHLHPIRWAMAFLLSFFVAVVAHQYVRRSSEESRDSAVFMACGALGLWGLSAWFHAAGWTL